MAQEIGPQRAQRSDYLSAIVMGVVTLGVMVALFLSWRQTVQQPRFAWERYLPTDAGTSARYRVTHPDGSVSTQSVNSRRWGGSGAINLLDGFTYQRALALALGMNPDKLTDSDFERLRLPAGNEALVGVMTYIVEQSASGEVQRRESHTVLVPTGPELLTQDTLRLVPSMPTFPSQLAVGESVAREGTIDGQTPYSMTLTVEAHEAVTVPVGTFDDCWRLLRVLDIAESFRTRARSWYCAGVGLTREEDERNEPAGTTRYELTALRTASQILTDGEVPAPTEPSLSSSIPLPATTLPDEVGPLWAVSSAEVTDSRTAPLVVGDLLIYGSERGELVAVDSELHTVRWHFQAGAGLADTPTVADGRLFFGSAERTIYALDAALGTMLWAVRTTDSVAASPVVAHGIAYVGSEAGTLYALDAATGAERWQATVGGSIAYRAAVAGDLLLVGADDGAVYAYDAATGSPHWAYATNDAIASAPVVADDTVYVASYDDTLYALDTTTVARAGSVRWSRPLDNSPSSGIVVAGTHLYLTIGGTQLIAVDRATGHLTWRHDSVDTLIGTPLLLGEQVAIARKTDILLLDAATGREVRHLPLGTSFGVQSGLSTDGEALYLAGLGGTLMAYGDTSAAPWNTVPLWRSDSLASALFQIPDSLVGSPALTADSLYVVSGLGHAFRVDRRTGAAEAVGSLATPASIRLAPVAVGERLVMLSEAGELIAIDLRSGEEAWRHPLGGLSRSAPVAVEGAVLVAVNADDETVVAAYDAAKGVRLWERRYPNSSHVSPVTVLLDGRFVVTADSLHAVDAVSGAELWHGGDDAPWPAALTAEGDEVSTVALQNHSWVIERRDGATGEPRAEPVPLALTTFPAFYASPMRAGDVMVVMDNDGTLVATDLASARELWRAEPTVAPAGPLVVHGETLLYQGVGNILVARALSDGRQLAQYDLETDSQFDGATYSPRVADGTVYVTGARRIEALVLK